MKTFYKVLVTQTPSEAWEGIWSWYVNYIASPELIVGYENGLEENCSQWLQSEIGSGITRTVYRKMPN